MKKALLYTALILFNTALFSQEFKREKYNFNSDWKLKAGDSKNAELPAFNDNSWKNVTLPHAYNQEEAFEKDIEHLTTGIVWYRKKFKLPKGVKDKKIFIEFECLAPSIVMARFAASTTCAAFSYVNFATTRDLESLDVISPLFPFAFFLRAAN